MHRNSFSRRGTILVPAFAALVGFVVVFLFVFEAGGGGALAQHDVERFFDVVGVQLLVEVDDVVVFLSAFAATVGGLDVGVVVTTTTATATAASSVVVDDVVVVEQVVIVVVVEVLVEDVLVEVVFVELGLVLELVVAHRVSLRRGEGWRACNRSARGGFFPPSPPLGARSITPRVEGLAYRTRCGGATGSDGLDGRVQETVGAAGWPGLHVADGLSQRSLLDSWTAAQPPVRPAPLRLPASSATDRWVVGVVAGGVRVVSHNGAAMSS